MRTSLALLRCSRFLLLGLLPVLAAGQTRYHFDVNGSDPGDGMSPWVDQSENPRPTYLWFNSPEGHWNLQADGEGAPQQWDNNQSLEAFFNAKGQLIQINGDITLGGMRIESPSSPSGQAMLFESIDPTPGGTQYTITMLDNPVFSTNRWVHTFGANVNIVGDFTIGQLSNNNSGFRLQGPGALYEGFILLNNAGGNATRGIIFDEGHRFGPNTRIQVERGRLQINAEVILAELSGTASDNVTMGTDNSSDKELILRQNTNTVFAGEMGNNNANSSRFGFIKEGDGRFVSTGNISFRQRFEISEGSFFVEGTVDRTTTAQGNFGGGNRIIVQEGATLGGGGLIINRFVQLIGANSVLHVGNYDQVGTLTLGVTTAVITDEGGLEALSGGRFQFRVNGLNELEETIHDFLQVDGTIFNVDGDLMIDVINLGLGDLTAGSPLALINAPGISANSWQVGLLPSGWAVGEDPFSVDDDTLYLTFTAVPEPGYVALLAAVMGILFLRRKTPR